MKPFNRARKNHLFSKGNSVKPRRLNSKTGVTSTKPSFNDDVDSDDELYSGKSAFQAVEEDSESASDNISSENEAEENSSGPDNVDEDSETVDDGDSPENMDSEEDPGEDSDDIGEEDPGKDSEDSEVENDDCEEEETKLSDAESSDEDDFSKHKESLNKLKDIDPELYKYLEENDQKLLKFDISDSEDSEDEDKSRDVHKPPESLEADSEESDFEDDSGTKKKGNVITLAQVAKWRNELSSEPNVSSLMTAVKAFEAALDRVTGERKSTYVVDGSGVFNAVVEMCVMDFVPAVTKFLKIPNAKQPDKSKKWVKVRTVVKDYLSLVLQLVSGVASGQIVSVLLKHVHSAAFLMIPFGKLMRTALKLLAKLWSSAEETTRVLAYLCILRIVTVAKEGQTSYLNHTLKLMYMGYVKGSKFVSVSTLPQINFMRRSLADLLTVNPTLSYQHAFVYIRQLAIHLRNAVTLLKKEKFQTVYNWQYINCLHLWIELICHNKPELKQLTYPLVTIIMGVIRLIPTAQYIPLRFQCIRMLNKLSQETDTFIPVFPLITDALCIANLNAKHKKVSMKPFDLTCILRLSKASMTETAFTEAVVENVYELLLEASFNYHSSIAFSDLLLPTIVQLKSIIKTTKSPKYVAKLKQILSKIEENGKLINSERNKFSVTLSDTSKIKAWETKLGQRGTPIGKLRNEWMRAHRLNTIKKITKADEINENDIPTIRKDLKRKANSGPAVLLPSDDEDEMTTKLCGLGVTAEKAEESAKKLKVEGKKLKGESDDDDVDGEDVVEEFNLDSF